MNYSNLFNKNGYIILKNFINVTDINNIFNDVENIFDKSLKHCTTQKLYNINDKYYWLKNNKPILKSHCYDLFGKLDSINKIFNNEILINIVKDILSSPIIIDKIQLRIDDKENDRILPMHQERGQISKKEITIWCPLINITENSGGVCIIPESHKYGDLGIEIYDKDYTGVPRKYIKNKNIQKIFMNKGDILIFHWDLIHGSFPNISNDIRYTCVARFNSIDKVPYINDENASLHINKVIN